jgi:endonuclease-3
MPTRPMTPMPVDEALRIGRLGMALDAHFPDPCCALDYRNPFELLVATVLSAQSTDVAVNRATPALFARFPTATLLAAVEPDAVIPFIRTLGLYNNKARALVGLARGLVERHGGGVPADLDALTALPGVARKTANVVLQNAFGIIEGFVVDTHVSRLAGRLALSGGRTPEAIERDLMGVFPRAGWARRSHQLILHGRETCDARRPRCGECMLAPDCPGRAGVGST